MKPIAKSRLFWALLAIVGGYLTIILRRHLPADLAAALSDELIGAVGAALGLGGVALRMQDRKRRITAGEIVERKIVPGADAAHPRCESVNSGHRCTRPDGHAGDHTNMPNLKRSKR